MDNIISRVSFILKITPNTNITLVASITLVLRT